MNKALLVLGLLMFAQSPQVVSAAIAQSESPEQVYTLDHSIIKLSGTLDVHSFMNDRITPNWYRLYLHNSITIAGSRPNDSRTGVTSLVIGFNGNDQQRAVLRTKIGKEVTVTGFLVNMAPDGPYRTWIISEKIVSNLSPSNSFSTDNQIFGKWETMEIVHNDDGPLSKVKLTLEKNNHYHGLFFRKDGRIDKGSGRFKLISPDHIIFIDEKNESVNSTLYILHGIAKAQYKLEDGILYLDDDRIMQGFVFQKEQ